MSGCIPRTREKFPFCSVLVGSTAGAGQPVVRLEIDSFDLIISVKKMISLNENAREQIRTRRADRHSVVPRLFVTAVANRLKSFKRIKPKC